MKNLLLSFVAVIFLSNLPCMAQSTQQPKTEQETKELLSHKWIVEAAETGGKKIPMPPGSQSTYFILQNDGTIIELDDGKKYQGSWTYDHTTKTLTTDDKDGVVKHIVTRINKTHLVFKDIRDGRSITWIVKRLD